MWGKVLAGAAIGVGAVAAAPFTGGGSLLGGASAIASLTGAGAVTAASAASGAGLGAAVGRVRTNRDKKEKENIKNEGRAEGIAESLLKMERLEGKLIEALERLKSYDAHFKAIIALEAVGVACAACDGDFSDNEKEEIGEFVKGMLDQNIPEDVKQKIQYIYDNPPTVEEAYILAEASGLSLDVYEDLIQFVMQIDGIKAEERVFVQAWSQLKAA